MINDDNKDNLRETEGISPISFQEYLSVVKEEGYCDGSSSLST